MTEAGNILKVSSYPSEYIASVTGQDHLLTASNDMSKENPMVQSLGPMDDINQHYHQQTALTSPHVSMVNSVLYTTNTYPSRSISRSDLKSGFYDNSSKDRILIQEMNI